MIGCVEPTFIADRRLLVALQKIVQFDYHNFDVILSQVKQGTIEVYSWAMALLADHYATMHMWADSQQNLPQVKYKLT